MNVSDRYNVAPPSLTVFDYIQLFFPFLVFFRYWIIRILFYVAFLCLNFVPSAPFQDLVVLGLLSQLLFTLILAVVAMLLCSDLMRIDLIKKQFVSFIRNPLYGLLVFCLAIGTVLATIFGAHSDKTDALNSFLMMYPEYSGSIYISMPYLQCALFLLLSCAVFIPSATKVIPITLSWALLIIITNIRIEWMGFFYLADAYTFFSAMLVWYILEPRESLAGRKDRQVY